MSVHRGSFGTRYILIEVSARKLHVISNKSRASAESWRLHHMTQSGLKSDCFALICPISLYSLLEKLPGWLHKVAELSWVIKLHHQLVNARQRWSACSDCTHNKGETANPSGASNSLLKFMNVQVCGMTRSKMGVREGERHSGPSFFPTVWLGGWLGIQANTFVFSACYHLNPNDKLSVMGFRIYVCEDQQKLSLHICSKRPCSLNSDLSSMLKVVDPLMSQMAKQCSQSEACKAPGGQRKDQFRFCGSPSDLTNESPSHFWNFCTSDSTAASFASAVLSSKATSAVCRLLLVGNHWLHAKDKQRTSKTAWKL